MTIDVSVARQQRVGHVIAVSRAIEKFAIMSGSTAQKGVNCVGYVCMNVQIEEGQFLI